MFIWVTSYFEGKQKILINTDYIISAVRKQKDEYVQIYDGGSFPVKHSEQLNHDATSLILSDGSPLVIDETPEEILDEIKRQMCPEHSV